MAFVCVLIGWLTPPAFRAMYGLKSLDAVRDFGPTITQLACEHTWLIDVVFATVCFGSLAAVRLRSDRPVQCIAVGLCAQDLVTWAAMFCFCFVGFTGPMCLHQGPEFELVSFAAFGAGIECRAADLRQKREN